MCFPEPNPRGEPRLSGWCALLIGLLCTSVAAATQPLTSVEEIRAVQAWSDLETHPLALEGVVTHVDPDRHLLIVQDRTGALGFDTGQGKIDVTPGQRVLLSASESWPPLRELPAYPYNPDRREWLPTFESVPAAQSGFYVARFRGLLYPPRTGDYRFAIASDDASDLLVGTDATPASRRAVAQVQSYTRERDWNRTALQRSQALRLEAGHTYYIEAVHHQSGGQTHLSVAWEGPGMPQQLITGQYLRPWIPNTPSDREGIKEAAAASGPPGAILREVWDNRSIAAPGILTAPRSLESVLSLRDAAVKVLGEERLPDPVLVQLGESLPLRSNFRWSEVEGTVDFVASDGEQLTLELSDRGQHLQAVMKGWRREAPKDLRGRRIRVVGAIESLWRNGEARAAGKLWLRPSSAIVVTDQAPKPDLARLTTISALTQGDPAAYRGTAVKLTGRVASQHGNRLTVSDDGTFSAFTSVDGKEWRAVGPPIELTMARKVFIGLAVNSRVPNASSTAVFTQVTGLSAQAKRIDIGDPLNEGKLAVEGGRFSIEGVGSDIWDFPDQFTFVNEPLDGAGSIVARLDSFAPADPAARAGLMIRESYAPDSQFVDLVQTTESGTQATSLQWRWWMAGSSTRSVNAAAPPTASPGWLKLERRFNTVSVAASYIGAFDPDEKVDVVGYVTVKNGELSLADSSVVVHRQDAAPPAVQDTWRPLVDIARLGDGDGKWGGLDYFRLRGVVTFCGEALGRHYWALQDQSAGTLLATRDTSTLFSVEPGNYVEVFSNPGWAPPTTTLFADNLFPLGPAAFPKPVHHPAEYLLPRRGEGTWVELEGILRAVADTGLLEVKVRGELFNIAMTGAQPARLRSLVDANVRLRGVIAYPNERERLLLVPSGDFLDVLDGPPPPEAPAAFETTRTLTVESLVNQSRHRTHLRGRVTHVDQGVVYLQDEYGGARAELDRPAPFPTGASVDVSGFPDWAEDDGILLRHAVVQVVSKGEGVVPAQVTSLEAAGGRFDYQLVRVRAVVARTLNTPEGNTLELEENQRLFRVVLPARNGSLENIPRGSLVEATGVSVKEAGLKQWVHASATTSSILPLRLLLRSPADVVVLQKPSWWVLKRALIIVSLAVAVGLLGSVWIHRLRQRVKQRTAELAATMAKLEKEARMSATLAERDRLAGEIHDSLEQGLNGLLLQLESTADAEACPPDIRASLKIACNMASFSRTEVQYAVWELQSPMLADSELPVAVEKIMRQITPEGLAVSVKVHGSPRRLPSATEHHLLRIAQEAINNTVKHAKASSVAVVLAYEPEAVVLTVTDDGCGFVPEAVRTGGLGHFGLRSLRSRVGKIRGTFEVASTAGKGTTIRVRVPSESP